MKVAIARLSVTWSKIDTADQVAAALESLAAKIRSEGDPVDLRVTLRYESAALKEKMKGEDL